jgi:hypothetical protein
MDYKEANKTLVNQEPPIRIRVRDNEANEWSERIPVKFNDDGSVLCVGTRYEENYLQNGTFEPVPWQMWELIPEKKKRLITGRELLKRGATHLVCNRNHLYEPLCVDIDSNMIYSEQQWMSIEDAYKQGCKWYNGDPDNLHSFMTGEE